MSEQSPLSQGLDALTRFFVADGTVVDTLIRVCELARDAIPVADEVGVTLLVEGRVRTAVYTDEQVPEVDQAQYETGDGPCLDAFRDQRVHRIDSTADEGSWPAFRASAAAHGIHSTLSMPMVINGEGVGAFNLYSRTDRPFSQDEERAAAQFASQAAIVAANSQAYWDAHELTMDLDQVVKSRAQLEQAKGILMARHRCGADEAFELLVAASQRENVKPQTVASRIVATVTDQRDDRDARE
jgi:GAF domain-containing protein